MGTLYTFTCTACGYSAEASGGADRGMIAEVQTVSCATCRELYDAVVRRHGLHEWGGTEVPLRCPEHADHQIMVWNQGDPCPRCGEPMPPGQVCGLWD